MNGVAKRPQESGPRRRRRPGRTSLAAIAGAALGAWICGPGAFAEQIVQWEFDGDLSSSTGHAALAAAAVPPAAAPSVTFEDLPVGGRTAKVARFSRGTYFRARPGFAPNGGGSLVNRYTLILDVLFPDRSPSGGWAALYQTSVRNSNDGDWFVNPSSGLGISGNYGGSVPEGEWHRLGLVVDLVAGTFTSFIDGVQVQENTGQAIDGRFAIYSASDAASDGFLLFADEDQENAEGYVDAVQVRDVALCPEDMAAIGSPSAGPLAPTPVSPGGCEAPPPPPLGLKEGPYLQWATASEITVMWETTAAADSTVSFRRGGAAAWEEASEPGLVKIHEVRLGGFAAGETVEYSVRSRAGAEEVESEPAELTTNPPGPVPSFGFTVFGDNHVNPAVFGALVRHMVTLSPDLAMSCGDVVNDGNVYEEWGRGFLTPLKPLARSVPFYVAIGNHERNARWFYDYMAQPGNEHWFSFDYAGCHFTVIDTNFPFEPGSEQYRWIEADLFSEAAQRSRWLFAFHHHPPYSEIIDEVIYARVRMHLVPLLESAGVDVDFTGHIHDYERGVYVPPDTGRRIAYVQTSGAGGRLWDDEYAGEWEQIEKVIQYVYHYCDVRIDEKTLSFRAIDLQGNTIDSFTLTESPREVEPPPPPPPPGGEALTQWDFEDGTLAATFGPGDLVYLDGEAGPTASLTRIGTTASLGVPGIGGVEAGAMRFPKAASPSMGFRLRPNAPPNGGGKLINNYSLVLDLYVPAASFASDLWLCFFNTHAANATDGDAFVKLSTGGIGISGRYDGRNLPDTWHRVAFVIGVEAGLVSLRKYIDGAEVGTQALGAVDGRWAVRPLGDAAPWLLLLTDDNGETTSGCLASLLFADRALSAAEVAGLGGPDAGGILDDPCPGGACPGRFRRGDSNGDGDVDVSDAVATLLYLFAGDPLPPCEASLDADDDGELSLSDAVRVLRYLFLASPSLAAPFYYCGQDPTPDALTCRTFGPCE
ncbi:MAG: metallophosphoesterase [Planctomycetes bacterium]|nr:metallophosphoesterase [Planctomycetota bacterium]